MLYEKDKLLDKVSKELKHAKERNIAILKEGKKKKKIIKDLEKDKVNLAKETQKLTQKLKDTNDDFKKETDGLKAANTTLQLVLESLQE